LQVGVCRRARDEESLTGCCGQRKAALTASGRQELARRRGLGPGCG